jgi:hypothetical protein
MASEARGHTGQRGSLSIPGTLVLGIAMGALVSVSYALSIILRLLANMPHQLCSAGRVGLADPSSCVCRRGGVEEK